MKRINIDTWTSGYKVRAFDWIDGKNIYINIAYYQPGASISKPPAWEKSFLLPLSEENKIREYLDSTVNHLARITERRYIFGYYINGQEVAR